MKVVQYTYGETVNDMLAEYDERTKHYFVSVGDKIHDAWKYRLPIDDRHIKNYGRCLNRVKIVPLISKFKEGEQITDSKDNLLYLLSSGTKTNRTILCIEEIVDEVVTVEYSLFGNIKTLGTGISRSMRNNKISIPMLYITGEAKVKIVRVYDDVIKTYTLNFDMGGYVSISAN